MLGPLEEPQGTSPDCPVPAKLLRYALMFLYRKQLFWLAHLKIFKIFSLFLAFYFYCSCKIRLMF